MDRFVSIPYDALTALLKASGSTLTPDQYLATFITVDPYRKFRGRATAAVWSKYFLLAAAALSIGLTCIPSNFGVEGVLVSVSLSVLTYFEYRVHAAFVERKPEAATLGFRNQSAFAAFILIYCLYHAFAPVQIPTEYREYVDPDLMGSIRVFTQAFYLLVGVVGGASQFGLACYYRSARILTETKV